MYNTRVKKNGAEARLYAGTNLASLLKWYLSEGADAMLFDFF
jgi:hypothetical protein